MQSLEKTTPSSSRTRGPLALPAPWSLIFLNNHGLQESILYVHIFLSPNLKERLASANRLILAYPNIITSNYTLHLYSRCVCRWCVCEDWATPTHPVQSYLSSRTTTYNATFTFHAPIYRGKPVVHGSDITTTETHNTDITSHKLARMECLSPFHPRPPVPTRPGPARFRTRRFRRRALVLPSPNASAGVRRQSSWFRATTSHGRIYAMHASLRPSLVHFHARLTKNSPSTSTTTSYPTPLYFALRWRHGRAGAPPLTLPRLLPRPPRLQLQVSSTPQASFAFFSSVF